MNTTCRLEGSKWKSISKLLGYVQMGTYLANPSPIKGFLRMENNLQQSAGYDNLPLPTFRYNDSHITYIQSKQQSPQAKEISLTLVPAPPAPLLGAISLRSCAGHSFLIPKTGPSFYWPVSALTQADHLEWLLEVMVFIFAQLAECLLHQVAPADIQHQARVDRVNGWHEKLAQIVTSHLLHCKLTTTP